MDATQMISDSILESDEEDKEEENQNNRGQPLAKLCILKNAHIPAAELPLYLGDNVLGRDPNTCTLPLLAPSVSKQHATICISVHGRSGRHGKVDMEALVWDLGSMNGTRKGRLKLTPNVRYALSEDDSLVVADIPCQYVSCAVETSLQGDMRTRISISSRVKAGLPDALTGKGGDTRTDSEKCVNGGTKATAKVSLLDPVDTKNTPAQNSCLSFEQTPTQPQRTLVPESDSDSDGERQRQRDGRRNALVSDSDSHKSSPTCSTFLSPTNKVVPESEDESPITPSSSTKGRPYSHVSFSKEEPDIHVGRQQLKKVETCAIVYDSEEEKGKEEERAMPGGTTVEESGQDVLVKQRSHASVTGAEELPVFASAVSKDGIPAFNLFNSDSDVEAEDEVVASVGHVTMNTNEKVDQPPDTVQFNMDSDTDVDEDSFDKGATAVPSSDDQSKSHHAVPLIQPEGITMDSDTDVDEDADVSDTAEKTKHMSLLSACTADSAASNPPQDFHLDSDTDVDEEEKDCGTSNMCSKKDESPKRLDSQPNVFSECASATHHSLDIDSDTDDEVIPAPAISVPPVITSTTGSCITTDAGADNSDTDVVEDSSRVASVAISTFSITPGIMLEAAQSDSDADTDVDEFNVPPAGDRNNPAGLGQDSDTDVEEKEVDLGEAGNNPIPSLRSEEIPGLLAPLLQNCSTPVQLSEGGVEEMETQAFLSPSQGPFRCALSSAVRPVALTCSESLEEEDFTVAETQSFVLQSRGCQSSLPDDGTVGSNVAFELESSGEEQEGQNGGGGSLHLGLSDSSHLQCQAQALATESTQAFVYDSGVVNLEATQAYAAFSTANKDSLENDSNLEATQANEGDGETARCPEMEGRVDLALQETQAYISELYNDSEVETEEYETDDRTTAETQSALATAETQPVLALVEDESSTADSPVSSVQQSEAKKTGDKESRKVHGEATQSQTKPLSPAPLIPETQPMCTSEDEALISGPRKRKAKVLQLEKEPQPNVSVGETAGIDATQPVATSGNEESDDEDSIPVPRRGEAKLRVEEEETQKLVNSEISTAETQLMDTREDGESDDEDSMPGPRKKKAKPLQFEEETQSLTSSVEIPSQDLNDKTQPRVTCEDAGSDDEDSMPGPRKRKAKQLRLEEEETQELIHSETSTAETQLMVTHEDEDIGDDDPIPGPRKRKAKPLQFEEETQSLTSADISAVATQARVAGEDMGTCDEESFVGRGKRKAKPLQLEREETQSITNSEASSVETQPVRTITGPQEGKERQSEAGTSGTSATHRRGTRAKLQEEKEQAESTDSPGRPTRGNKAFSTIQGRRGKSRLVDNQSEEEEEVEQVRKRKSIKQQRDDEDEVERLQSERNEHPENINLTKEQQEGMLEEKNDDTEKEQEHLARLENEAKEREERDKLDKEKAAEEKQIKDLQETKEIVIPARGRRTTRRTIAAPCTSELEQDTIIATNDDVPARRTRSRSNSSNSISSERSATSVNTQGSRGRGRGARKTSGPAQAAIPRVSNRRRTVAAEPSGLNVTTELDSNNPSQGILSRSNSSNSLNSEISSCSVSSRSRGRGGRQRGRGRKTQPEPQSTPPISGQIDQNPTSKSPARGRTSRKAESSSTEVSHDNVKEKPDSQQAAATRGRRRANVKGPEHTTTDKQDQLNQEGACDNEEPLQPKRNVRGKGHKTVKSETVETPLAPPGSSGDETKDKRQARKRELGATADDAPTTEAAVVEGKDENPAPIQAKRRGRASSALESKKARESPPEVEVKKEIVGRSRPPVGQNKKQQGQKESETSVNYSDANAETSAEPRTPTSRASRKRQAPVESSPAARTPRSSSVSPATSGRRRTSSQVYKVLFTGVVDEEGERVLARLGGSMADGVADMNCLVTDKVRRTVKFLCAVAKGIPIVTLQWLEKSGTAGSFLSPNAFFVNDPEQERKFNFCLQESLRVASSQPLLLGYGVHITKSVKPEPVYMKDILSCSGATFLPKMPSCHKPHTVVISCEEDRSLCSPALSASLPVVSAEFILSGILQQKLDFQTHKLSGFTANLQPAGSRGRGRKKT